MTGFASTIAVEGDVAKLKQIETQLRRMTSVFLEAADSIIFRDLEDRILDVKFHQRSVARLGRAGTRDSRSG